MTDKLHRLLSGKVVLVTGGTRGIGKAIALAAAEAGANIVVTYRDPAKLARAKRTLSELESQGVEVLLLQVDITSEIDRQAMYEAVEAQFGRLDALVLNAAGGLEAEKEGDYAQTINRDAQLALVQEALKSRLMGPGSWVLYMTSLWAHRYGQIEPLPEYGPVARTKFAAEQELRALQPALAEQGAKLGVVVGHLITDTGAYTLFKRYNRAMIDQLSSEIEGGQFPTPADVATATLDFLSHTDWPTGQTVFVGQPKD